MLDGFVNVLLAVLVKGLKLTFEQVMRDAVLNTAGAVSPFVLFGVDFGCVAEAVILQQHIKVHAFAFVETKNIANIDALPLGAQKFFDMVDLSNDMPCT